MQELPNEANARAHFEESPYNLAYLLSQALKLVRVLLAAKDPNSATMLTSAIGDLRSLFHVWGWHRGIVEALGQLADHLDLDWYAHCLFHVEMG